MPDFYNLVHRVDATPMQVALAWLLHRAPNVLLIPGTSSQENLKAAALKLPDEAFARLGAIGERMFNERGTRHLEVSP